MTFETNDYYSIRFEMSNNSSAIRFEMKKNTIRTAPETKHTGAVNLMKRSRRRVKTQQPVE